MKCCDALDSDSVHWDGWSEVMRCVKCGCAYSPEEYKKYISKTKGSVEDGYSK